MTNNFRIALIQMTVGMSKAVNVKHAIANISKAISEQQPKLVALPECFNTPYDTKYFRDYAEIVPDGETCQKLSETAKKYGIYLIGGTIPEIDKDNPNIIYNTCTIWSPSGTLIGKHRKMHLFDMNIKDGTQFKESDVLTAGNNFTTFSMDDFKIGIGICYDMRFDEMARIYRNMGCDMLIYPGAFNMTTAPLHWDLLQRSRANDTQSYVATVSVARDESVEYVAWGYSMVVNPWGTVIASAGKDEEIVYADIDMTLNKKVREQIPIFQQRRNELYDTIRKIEF